ncbi:MAG: alcohol dehydrogenase catalytic domain-containing protein [Deltaproteobacteria bacterium]|nr:alcohol dehydrogenase catalytic domain-containing protein [Deltaproteobacteria bacterium]
MKVEMVAICGSDVHLYEGVGFKASFPKILGHEFVGQVTAMGEKAAEAYELKIGDRVTVEPYIPCRNCRFCLTGNYQNCVKVMTYGVSLTCDVPPYLWGAYGEYIYIAPGSLVYPVGKGVPAEAAALSSVIGNGVRWVKRKGEVGPGDAVVIMGPGAQGLASTIVAREAGAEPLIVLGLGRDSLRLKLAEKFGATETVNVQAQDAKEIVGKKTAGQMADVVIDCTGDPEAFNVGLQLLHPGGRYVMVGLTGGRVTPAIMDHVVRQEIQIRGGLGQAWCVDEAMKIIHSRRYPVESIITHRRPLAEAQEALEFFINPPADCIRVALVP